MTRVTSSAVDLWQADLKLLKVQWIENKSMCNSYTTRCLLFRKFEGHPEDAVEKLCCQLNWKCRRRPHNPWQLKTLFLITWVHKVCLHLRYPMNCIHTCRWFPVCELPVVTWCLGTALGKRMCQRQQEALPCLSHGEREPGHWYYNLFLVIASGLRQI